MQKGWDDGKILGADLVPWHSLTHETRSRMRHREARQGTTLLVLQTFKHVRNNHRIGKVIHTVAFHGEFANRSFGVLATLLASFPAGRIEGLGR